jgi:hypothetical protein
MEDTVRISFERRIAVLPLAMLLPLKTVPPAIKQTVRFRRIAKSVAEVGIIEPLVVARSKEHPGRYLLLDGHIRHAVLADAGAANARCLMAEDDEAFTYNKRINRLATIQEHFMIVRAIERGVSEEKLAKALDLDTKAIHRRRTMLTGICPEVVDLLKEKSLNPSTLRGIAENVGGLTPEQMARMEREMEALQQDLKTVESRYGDDVLHLVIASGYLAKLVANRNIKRYLNQHHPEILSEFTAIVAAASFDQTNSME